MKHFFRQYSLKKINWKNRRHFRYRLVKKLGFDFWNNTKFLSFRKNIWKKKVKTFYLRRVYKKRFYFSSLRFNLFNWYTFYKRINLIGLKAYQAFDLDLIYNNFLIQNFRYNYNFLFCFTLNKRNKYFTDLYYKFNKNFYFKKYTAESKGIFPYFSVNSYLSLVSLMQIPLNNRVNLKGDLGYNSNILNTDYFNTMSLINPSFVGLNFYYFSSFFSNIFLKDWEGRFKFFFYDPFQSSGFKPMRPKLNRLHFLLNIFGFIKKTYLKKILKKYSIRSAKNKISFFFSNLDLRLDRILFLMKMVYRVKHSKIFIQSGWVFVNNKCITNSNYVTKIGDLIQISLKKIYPIEFLWGSISPSIALVDMSSLYFWKRKNYLEYYFNFNFLENSLSFWKNIKLRFLIYSYINLNKVSNFLINFFFFNKFFFLLYKKNRYFFLQYKKYFNYFLYTSKLLYFYDRFFNYVDARSFIRVHWRFFLGVYTKISSRLSLDMINDNISEGFDNFLFVLKVHQEFNYYSWGGLQQYRRALKGVRRKFAPLFFNVKRSLRSNLWFDFFDFYYRVTNIDTLAFEKHNLLIKDIKKYGLCKYKKKRITYKNVKKKVVSSTKLSRQVKKTFSMPLFITEDYLDLLEELKYTRRIKNYGKQNILNVLHPELVWTGHIFF